VCVSLIRKLRPFLLWRTLMEMVKLIWENFVNSWELEVETRHLPLQPLEMHLQLSQSSGNSINQLTKFAQLLINMMLIEMEVFPNKSLNKEWSSLVSLQPKNPRLPLTLQTVMEMVQLILVNLFS